MARARKWKVLWYKSPDVRPLVIIQNAPAGLAREMYYRAAASLDEGRLSLVDEDGVAVLSKFANLTTPGQERKRRPRCATCHQPTSHTCRLCGGPACTRHRDKCATCAANEAPPTLPPTAEDPNQLRLF